MKVLRVSPGPCILRILRYRDLDLAEQLTKSPEGSPGLYFNALVASGWLVIEGLTILLFVLEHAVDLEGGGGQRRRTAVEDFVVEHAVGLERVWFVS